MGPTVQSVTKEYRHRYQRLAQGKFEADAAKMAGQGWVPTQVAWVERQSDCLSTALTLGLVEIWGQGGKLVVTYSKAAPAPPPAWTPTHRAPGEGMPAWAVPNGSLNPIVTLAGGLALAVIERKGDWARVVAVNGWTGWVDGRRLVPK